jgi:hypothetical protein
MGTVYTKVHYFWLTGLKILRQRMGWDIFPTLESVRYWVVRMVFVKVSMVITNLLAVYNKSYLGFVSTNKSPLNLGTENSPPYRRNSPPYVSSSPSYSGSFPFCVRSFPY